MVHSVLASSKAEVEMLNKPYFIYYYLEISDYQFPFMVSKKKKKYSMKCSLGKPEELKVPPSLSFRLKWKLLIVTT